MATFVLVHGAWHGSWCWKRVRKALQDQGHQVFTPTLTGLAERSHLLSPGPPRPRVAPLAIASGPVPSYKGPAAQVASVPQVVVRIQFP